MTQPLTTSSAEGPVQPDELRAGALRRARILMEKLPLPAGTALVAAGSYARGEMTPYSDLDLMLLTPEGMILSDDQVRDVFNPLWESHLRVDYSVRSTADCEAIIPADTTAALSLLEIVHVAGNEKLWRQTRDVVIATWRSTVKKNFAAIADTAITRWRHSGSVVTMTHPDLKHGRGGLRDIEFLKALALGNLCDVPPIENEHKLFVDVRTLLHMSARRARDVLDPEFAADIAHPLGFSDRYSLSRAIADAARGIDDALQDGLNTARRLLPRRGVLRRRARRPLDVDVFDDGGTVTLAGHVDTTDPTLPLRVAAAAARSTLAVPAGVWKKLAGCPPLPEPWPQAATEDFLTMLASPKSVATLIEDMDRYGLWEKYVPEWPRIRGLLPREPSHVHTVDRHLIDTVAASAAHTVHVARPDLLVLAALIHDLGKGTPRSHSLVGADIAARMTTRMGLGLQDRSVVQTLVAEHTTLMRLATRYDPDDPGAVDRLLAAVHYDRLTINLLEELTRADALSTGPTVLTPMLKTSIARMTAAAKRQLAAPPPPRPFITVDKELTLHETSPGQFLVTWQGTGTKQLVPLLALMRAQGLAVTTGAVTADRRKGQEEQTTSRVRARFTARATTPGEKDPARFVQAWKSGVYSSRPPVDQDSVTCLWHGTTLEIRTPDRPGVFALLVEILPDFEWAVATTPGATFIAHLHFLGAFSRADVEKKVLKSLSCG